jgi:hypothetical protein
MIINDRGQEVHAELIKDLTEMVTYNNNALVEK